MSECVSVCVSSPRLQESQASLQESQRTSSELGQKLQEVQLARSTAEQVSITITSSLHHNKPSLYIHWSL